MLNREPAAPTSVPVETVRLVALTSPPFSTIPCVEVSDTLVVPTPPTEFEIRRLPPFAVRSIDVPVKAPKEFIDELVAVTVSDEPELVFSVTWVKALSTNETAPDELAVRDVAFTELAAAAVIPPVPDVKFAIGALSAPVVVIPPATSDARRVNDVAELVPSDTTPANVSLILTTPVASETVSAEAFSEPLALKSTPAVPELKLVVADANAPLAFMPPAAFDAFNVNELAALAPSDTTPANVSLMVTVPVASVIWSALLFNEPEVLKSTPPEPAVNVAVGVVSAAVPSIPPAALLAFTVNEVPMLGPSDITPAKVSRILTAPVASTMVSEFELSEPVELKSTPPVPAVMLTVGAAKAPVALTPPAAFDALSVSDEALPAFNEMTPA